MSEQMMMLRDLIGSAKNGNKDALDLLRTIVATAATHAPVQDLIGIAEYVYHLGVEADRVEKERN